MKQKILYSSWVVYQAILPGIHISSTGVNTTHLNYGIPVVFSWLFPFSFLRGLLPHLVFWENGGDLLVFWPCNLGNLSAPQKGGVLGQYFVLELFQVFQPFPFILLLCKPPFLSFFSCLSFSHLSSFLSSSLDMMDLCCLFQLNLELLLLFMPHLYLKALLFKHFSIIIGNVGRNEERHDNTEERWKNFLFVYILLIYALSWYSLNKLNKTSKTQF